MKRALLIAALLFVANAAQAQTATVTPTVTPTRTPTNTGTVTPTMTPSFMPTGLPRVRANVISDNVVLLDAVTATGSGTPRNVRNYGTKSVQVTIGPVCSSYTLVIEGYISGPSWATLQTVTDSNVAAGATGIYTVTTALEYMQARVTAVSGCTISAYLEGVP